jgi:hypothetical protein
MISSGTMPCMTINRGRGRKAFRPIPAMSKADVQRFWSKVELGAGGCWLWQTGLYPNGYAKFSINGEAFYGHRVAWHLVHGSPVPPTLDHLCRIRHCVNAARHLEGVTQRENLHRSPITQATLRAAKTHCPKGHAYVGVNLYIEPKTGNRKCRACMAEASRRHYLRNIE